MSLGEASAAFADNLNDVLDATVDTDVRFRVSIARNGLSANLEATNYPAGRYDGIPLIRPNDDPVTPVMLLQARFAVDLDPEDNHLQVMASTVGLWVDVTGGRKRPRPIVRVEYDRRKVAGDRAAAHVHIHAHSPELAWIYGSSGRPAANLHALHFPVGGRRFRPTLEDFLLFLDREHIFTHFKEDWRPAVRRSLREWEKLQAMSTVRQYPRLAADTLRNIGYAVTRVG